MGNSLRYLKRAKMALINPRKIPPVPDMKKLQSTDGIQPILDLFYTHGVWPKDDSSGYYMAYFTFNVIVFLVVYVLSIAGSLFVIEDLASYVERIYISFSVILVGIKFTLLMSKRRTLIEFMEKLKTELKPISSDEEEVTIIQKAIKRAQMIFYFIRTVYFCALLVSNSTPLFFEERSLPYKAYFPFDWEHSMVFYVITYLFQLIGMYFVASWDSGIDVFAPCTLITLCGYLEALGYNLRMLGWKEGVNEKEERQRFHILVEKYTNLVQIAKSIEDLFSEILFVQFSIGGVIICMTAFRMSLVSVN